MSPPHWGLAAFGEGLVNELCLRNPLPYSQLPCYYSQPECSALPFPLLRSHQALVTPHPSWTTHPTHPDPGQRFSFFKKSF